MIYDELIPDSIFSQHIETFWQLEVQPAEINRVGEVFAPDCTFDIIFCTYPITLSYTNAIKNQILSPGANFVGQKLSSVQIEASHSQTITGIRFKPFAFAHLFALPPKKLNNRVLSLEKIFDLGGIEKQLIQSILENPEKENVLNNCEKLVDHLLGHNLYIDQTFRAHLNYILERKGVLKISELISEFGISKVTLRNHFLNKMGLPPKKVSRIWRLNYFLELHKYASKCKLTQLALEAGYYDQAHFNREFKFFFNFHPLHLFQQESQLLKISQEIIAKRFSNQYDPRL